MVGDLTMAAPLGNRFWEARSSHGPKPKFDSPEQLWDACCEYFAWVEENPLLEEKGFAFQGIVTKEKFAKMRAMTLDGLTLFLDVTMECWRKWRTERQDLVGVITQAERIIRQQKFAGAAADLLNANIISRDLGLADKSEFTGKDGKDLIPEASDVDAARAIAFVLAKGVAKQG